MKKRERNMRFKAAKKLHKINSRIMKIQRLLGKYEKTTHELDPDIVFTIYCENGSGSHRPMQELLSNMRTVVMQKLMEVVRD